mmetsp:Transcript_24557/g.47772  ORF Transcript_24557/g.47772 Transcript_24557/m.47772 type:complete len:358 (-) Transcript_24557:96-1169(-)
MSSPCADKSDGIVTWRSIGADFANFQGRYALRKVRQPRSDLEWTYYQAGPMEDREPTIFLHGTTGTAAAFFYQVQALGEKGYRAISAQYPAYDTPEDWCKGLDHFFDALRCRSVHIFGAGLGGFLAQHMAARYPNRVRSLMLCNSFATTHMFASQSGTMATVVQFMPTVLVRKMILDSFPETGMSLSAKQAIDWVAQQVNDINGCDLASRLCMMCTPGGVGALPLDQERMTLLESNGVTMVPEELRRQLRGHYSEARIAQLKAGGDFPYISQPDETTLFVEVHLRRSGISPGRTLPADPVAVTAQQFHAAPVEGADSSEREGHGLPEQEDAAITPEVSTRRPVWKNPFEEDPVDPLL